MVREVRGARLSDDDVREIRRAFARGASEAALARKYDITVGSVHYIVHRMTYRSVPDEAPTTAESS